MNNTMRILSATLVSLAAFHANASSVGDESFYPMQTRDGAPATGAAAAASTASMAQPYVWTGNEAGLVHSHTATSSAARGTHDAAGAGVSMPADQPASSAPRTADRNPIFLGA